MGKKVGKYRTIFQPEIPAISPVVDAELRRAVRRRPGDISNKTEEKLPFHPKMRLMTAFSPCLIPSPSPASITPSW
jgi:hypothetical protein